RPPGGIARVAVIYIVRMWPRAMRKAVDAPAGKVVRKVRSVAQLPPQVVVELAVVRRVAEDGKIVVVINKAARRHVPAAVAGQYHHGQPHHRYARAIRVERMPRSAPVIRNAVIAYTHAVR